VSDNPLNALCYTNSPDTHAVTPTVVQPSSCAPKGRWAIRADESNLVVKSVLDNMSIHGMFNTQCYLTITVGRGEEEAE